MIFRLPKSWAHSIRRRIALYPLSSPHSDSNPARELVSQKRLSVFVEPPRGFGVGCVMYGKLAIFRKNSQDLAATTHRLVPLSIDSD
ncbi:hypothetical protein K443DRAFT_674448, partial [Laccaria amethystina LaAM-08-1]